MPTLPTRFTPIRHSIHIPVTAIHPRFILVSVIRATVRSTLLVVSTAIRDSVLAGASASDTGALVVAFTAGDIVSVLSQATADRPRKFSGRDGKGRIRTWRTRRAPIRPPSAARTVQPARPFRGGCRRAGLRA